MKTFSSLLCPALAAWLLLAPQHLARAQEREDYGHPKPAKVQLVAARKLASQADAEKLAPKPNP